VNAHRAHSRASVTVLVATGALVAGGTAPATAATQTLHGTVTTHERFCEDTLFSTPEASGVWNLQLKDDRALWSLNLSTDGSKDVAYGGFALPPLGPSRYGVEDLFVVTIVDEHTVTLEASVAPDCETRGYDRVRMTGTVDRGPS
jgi:hypothetical protein